MGRVRGFVMVAGAAMALTTAPAALAQDCLPWGPTELTGIVLEGVYPGPPDFTSVANGDTAIDAALLHLSDAICIEASPEEPDAGPLMGVDLIQLSCDLKKLPEGQAATLSGNLVPRHTPYHVAAALLVCN